MNLGSLSFSPAGVTLFAVLSAVTAVALWWFIRKRQKKVWLPTVRILDLEPRSLPKLQIVRPPAISFLCFLLSAVALLFFSLSPSRLTYTPFEPDEARFHFFLDLSPSVQRSVSIDEYRQTIVSLWEKLSKSGRVTLSSSVDVIAFNPGSRQELESYLEKLDFHRSGVHLGNAIKNQIEELGDVDRLLIFSDGDLHSWNDLNWRYLSEDMDVVLVDTLRGDHADVNVYIDQADYVSVPSSSHVEWDVSIMARGKHEELQGVVRVLTNETELARVRWIMSPLRDRVKVRLGWPVTKMPENLNGGIVNHLRFELQPDQVDKLTIDNVFRSEIRGYKQNALMIAGVSGEMELEDPTHHLRKILEVMDFYVKRLEMVEQPGPEPSRYPFWIVMGGRGQGIDRFCPKSIESARLAKQSSQGARDLATTKLPYIWLIPDGVETRYTDLCWCFARLMISDDPLKAMPSYCSEVNTRDQYVGVLSSLGAKQIGGEVTNISQAVAFHAKDKRSGLETLAFTVPLQPSRMTGMSYATLPIMVKTLLTWQGFLSKDSSKAASQWPRIEDITNVTAKTVSREVFARRRLSNVPSGESALAQIEASKLPPKWIAAKEVAKKQLTARKTQSDPTPWIRLVAQIIVVFLVVEAIAMVVFRVRSLRRATSLIAILLLSSFTSGTSLAKVKISMLGYDVYGEKFSRLSRQVSNRTSIDVSYRPNMFSSFEQSSGVPWLWVKELSAITNQEGRLKSEVTSWIKRGGFLILDTPLAKETLRKLTEGLFHAGKKQPEWQAIPPDHELMRSFHLLDSLPICSSEVWQGFHFDARLAILAIPINFLETLLDNPREAKCQSSLELERSVRVFVNLLMVVLATDYKKDQIHLPEILKRLR